MCDIAAIVETGVRNEDLLAVVEDSVSIARHSVDALEAVAEAEFL
jgi:hypothetical protein